MEISVSQAQGKVPVTIIKTKGPLDGSNYEELIAKGKEVFDAGAHDILLDLGETDYMSTAGMVAIQSIARMLRGEDASNTEGGWDAIHDIAREGMAKQAHLKLLNPTPRVTKSLEAIGFTGYFEIFTNQDEAVSSF